MFKAGKEFHLLHVVSDLDAADGWYDDGLLSTTIRPQFNEGRDAQGIAGADQ
jgi:hypothetical protein